MKSIDLNQAQKFSASLTYLLHAREINWERIVQEILNQGKNNVKEDLLIDVLKFLHSRSIGAKRRLGSPAILHPIRTTAFLCQYSEKITLSEVIASLLHDFIEDSGVGIKELSDGVIVDEGLKSILNKLDFSEKESIIEYLKILTKLESENYLQYISRLLKDSANNIQAVRIKLADRLDNTLDFYIDIQDILNEFDFYYIIHQIEFNNSFTGIFTNIKHSSSTFFNGSKRLYQLFKNIIVLNLVRLNGFSKNDDYVKGLYNNLAESSMKEAQRIVVHILTYHLHDLKEVRELLKEFREYNFSGGINKITPHYLPGYKLDGLIMSYLFENNKKELEKKLAILYEDKSLMLLASLAFEVIFNNFIINPDYLIKGIELNGIFEY